jgi:uncharacterized protein (TIGR02646 family)
MIRVVRPDRVPAILLRRGDPERKRLCAAFDRAADDYKSGRKDLPPFKSSIYGAKSVKRALLAAQHDKCAFCESRVSAIAYGDVEHFRPKRGYRQNPEDELAKPGYYWLAYEWSNLLFSCQICNQQCKKNLFPLRNPGRRARSHHDDLSAEKPLLIDPTRVDPELHIGFRDEVAFPRAGRQSGRVTIDVLGLNRPALRERRRDHLIPLKLLSSVRDLLRGQIAAAGPSAPKKWLARLEEIESRLEASQEGSAEYAAMARAALDS